MNRKNIRVLQFICPIGFYGAERWILTLVNNSDVQYITHDLAVTEESCNQDLEIVNQFTKCNGRAYKIPMKSRFDLSAVKQLTNIIKERDIDIIHSHGYKSDILGFIAAKVTGIKCVSTPHGFGQPSSLKHKLFIKFGAISLRFFDQVVPLSKQLQDEVLSFKVKRNKITYIKNGVDLTEVEKYLVATEQRASTTKTIGFIGQMIPRKNIKDILDIFDEIHTKLPNLKLQLLGDGESRSQLEEYAKSLRSFHDIDFLGYQSDRLNYLKNFDLFVMTSIDEGIPRCLMEAMGMGIAVAAYNIKGIDQLVTHEKTGLLADFGDKKTLSDYWIELLSNTNKAERLANEGRTFVNNEFSGNRMANDYLDLYHKLFI